ncbi:MAG: hypothetical protein WBQ23_05500 [Bacteroidota bacterium]
MKTLASILLSLLLFQSAGPLFLLQLQQQQIRREMKRVLRSDIPDAELQRFAVEADGSFAGGELEWEDAHEFRYRGVMYDVARSYVNGSQTVYLCVRDDAETAVFAQLDRLVREENGSNPRHHRQSEQILQHVLALFWQESDTPALISPLTGTLIAPQGGHPLTRAFVPPDPPPEV